MYLPMITHWIRLLKFSMTLMKEMLKIIQRLSQKSFFSAKFLVMASKRPLILETGELRWGVVPPCWCSGKFVGTVELNWIEMLSNVSLQPKFNASPLSSKPDLGAIVGRNNRNKKRADDTSLWQKAQDMRGSYDNLVFGSTSATWLGRKDKWSSYINLIYQFKK